MNESKTFETFDGKTWRTYAITLGPVQSDLGERDVLSKTLVDEQEAEGVSQGTLAQLRARK